MGATFTLTHLLAYPALSDKSTNLNVTPFIARECGLPCVTGVPKVTALIATGDRIAVDGYLGIVTVL